MTSLHHAACSGRSKCVEVLLEEGAAINAALPAGTGASPLNPNPDP
jgi:ankyrin repeat protein